MPPGTAAAAGCGSHRSRQLGRPNPLPRQVVSPALALAGEVVALSEQSLVQLTGEQRDAVRPGVVPEEMAGHSDLAAAAGAQHPLIEIGPFLDGSLMPKRACAPAGPMGASRESSHGRPFEQLQRSAVDAN